MSNAEAMGYTGRARLDDDEGREVSVRIPNVEDPHWLALVVEGGETISSIGEVSVLLLDGDLYGGWRGTAVVSRSSDNRVRLMGHEPFTPPVGA
jgi:hypothetical protein